MFALGFISIVNFSFEWEFFMPPSMILAGVLIVAGGVVVASGLMGLEPHAKTSIPEGGKREPGGIE